MNREYWMVRVHRRSGVTDHVFCEKRAEAERVVREAKAAGDRAYYWDL